MRCLLSGLPNKVIAKAFNITEALRCKVHLKGVMKNTDGRSDPSSPLGAPRWALDRPLAVASPSVGAGFLWRKLGFLAGAPGLMPSDRTVLMNYSSTEAIRSNAY